VLLPQALHDSRLAVGVTTRCVSHGLYVSGLGDGATQLEGVGALAFHDFQVLREGGREDGRERGREGGRKVWCGFWITGREQHCDGTAKRG